MQKIEKCSGKDCPIKNNCYRYVTNNKSEYVVNFKFDLTNSECKEFIPTKFISDY